MLVAHGSDVPLAARRQHRAAGAALGAGARRARRALGALGAAVAPPPGPAPRAGALWAVHLALGDTGRSVTVIATVRFAPASTAPATAALVAAAFALRSLTAIAVVAALAARVAVALAALEMFAATFAAGQRAADLAWAAAGGAAHARGSEALDGARQTPGEAARRVLLCPDADVGDAAEARRGVAAGASVVVGDGLAQLSNPDVSCPRCLHVGVAEHGRAADDAARHILCVT
mmetsp:Transcript_15894/g.61914  ORF Transcript_15894/g.61914 Transcript_15894/m.61914 type:complete len:233 (+) Transcript_15894:631-1329(+)